MDAHLRDLRYFVAVAEELHFTRAAERLHISQPALSKQIRQLERDLGFQLFEREHRQVALTDAGSLLLAQTRELLDHWDETLAEATRVAREAASLLHIGFQTSVAGPLYQAAVSLFRKRHSNWSVELKLHSWADPTAGLADRSSDVAFVWLPLPGRPQLHSQVLRHEPRRVALWPDHRLADRGELRIADLLDEPFVALPAAAGPARDFWLALDNRDSHPVRIGAQVETPDEAFEAVAARQGVVLLSEGNAELYSRPGIITLPVIDLTPAELAIAWRTDDRRPITLEFVDAAQQAAAAYPSSKMGTSS